MLVRWAKAFIGRAPMGMTETVLVVVTGGLGLLTLAQFGPATEWWAWALAAGCVLLVLRGVAASAAWAARSGATAVSSGGRALRTRVPRVRLEWPTTEGQEPLQPPAPIRDWFPDPTDLRTFHITREQLDDCLMRARALAYEVLAPDSTLQFSSIVTGPDPKVQFYAESRLAEKSTVIDVTQTGAVESQVWPLQDGDLATPTWPESELVVDPWNRDPRWHDLLLAVFYRTRTQEPVTLRFIDRTPEHVGGQGHGTSLAPNISWERWIACLEASGDRCFQFEGDANLAEFAWFRG